MKKYLLALSAIAVFPTCDDGPKHPDSITSGKIYISVDETYRPVMEEQIKVFEGRNPEAKIIAEYKPESECFADFLKDSTRLIFVTRVLNDAERQQCEAKKIAITRELSVARDAIAFIVGKESNNKYLQNDFEKILKGENTEYQIVFDNDKSSTYRFLLDSIIKSNAAGKNAFALNGGIDTMIKYVNKNPKAIGAIGVSYIADKRDENTEKFLDQIKVIGILPKNDSIAEYRKPYQAYIGLKEYPYTRELFFVSKEAYSGLGTGFVNYLCKDGQLLFSKARLFPIRSNVFLRQVDIKTKQNK